MIVPLAIVNAGLAVGLCVTLASMGRAGAEPAGPVPVEARGHFEAGAKAYKLGDFSRAIEEYRRSYEIYPAPLLLFDLGQAYRKAGQNEKALFSYQQYLAETPGGKYRAAAEEMIASLQDLVKREQATKAQPPVAAPEPPPRSAVPPEPASARAAQGPSSSPPVGTSGASRKVPGIVLLAAGGAVAIAGGALLGYAVPSANQANSAATSQDRNQQLETGKNLSVAGSVFLSIGAAAAVAGAIVLAVPGSKEKKPAAWWILPSVGGVYAGGGF